MNSSPIGAHNFIWSSIEVVITRRTRNPLALRGPWVRIPPAPPEAKHPARVLFYLYEKGLPAKEPYAKNRKAYQGSLQVSSTNESGVRALALPHAWVLLGSRTVGKAMGRPFYVQTKGQLFPTCLSYAGYAHQREESPAALFLIAFLSSVFWYCTVFCLSSADFRRREV